VHLGPWYAGQELGQACGLHELVFGRLNGVAAQAGMLLKAAKMLLLGKCK